jgi:hypothetical protein
VPANLPNQTQTDQSSAAIQRIRNRVLPAERRGKLDAATRLPRIRRLAKLMDEAFQIPGTQYRVGLDSLVGLIPGVGDLGTMLVSAYIVREGWLLGLPKRKLAQMGWNVFVDTTLGAVPALGDLFDWAFKSNSKNVKLIEDYLAKQKQ